jgi:hypothetical protein
MHHNVPAPRLLAVSFIMVMALAACQSKDTPNDDSLARANAAGTVPDIKVAEVQLGKAIGADMKVTRAATQFSARDTVYLSVATTGMAQDATMMLMVTSLADTTVLVQDNKTISPSAPAVTEIHFSKPEGIKVGKYKAEIYLNGSLADQKQFEVVKGG